MFELDGSNRFLLLAVLVFVAAILFVEGLYLLWRAYRGPQAQRVQKRLRALTPAHQGAQQADLFKRQGLSDVPALERLLAQLPSARGLQAYIGEAGLQWTVSGVLLSCLALGAVTFIGANSAGRQSALFSAAAACVIAAVPLFVVMRKRTQRLARVGQQLPDAIDLVTRALRAGHAFSSALAMAGDELAEPIATEFRIVHDEINFGVSLQEALVNLSRRVPVTDLRYFVVAVLIQRESGGNLTEVLSNLSRLIRERIKFAGRVRVLSSEGRFSAWILGVMPFALGSIMNLVNPEFMSLMWTDPLGVTMIQYLLVMMAFGALVMRKIIKIRI